MSTENFLSLTEWQNRSISNILRAFTREQVLLTDLLHLNNFLFAPFKNCPEGMYNISNTKIKLKSLEGRSHKFQIIKYNHQTKENLHAQCKIKNPWVYKK